MKRLHVLEYSAPQVTDDGVIRGVKILGQTSRNGRRYPPEVQRAAKHLYEGAPVFILHGEPQEKRRGTRRLAEHFGSLQNIRERGTNGNIGLFGDLHTKPSHPMQRAVLEALPDAQFGLSHNAIVEMNNDETEVLAIIAVQSVDLVDSPATTRNLFEGEEMSTLNDIAAGEKEPAADKADKQEPTILQVLEQIQNGIAEMNKAIAERAEPGKAAKKRIQVLEKKTDAEEDGPAIGETHEDFLAAIG